MYKASRTYQDSSKVKHPPKESHSKERPITQKLDSAQACKK